MILTHRTTRQIRYSRQRAGGEFLLLWLRLGATFAALASAKVADLAGPSPNGLHG